MKLSTINTIEHPNFAANDAWMFETHPLPCPAPIEVRPLTEEEIINVEMVTIRESGHHRCWPRGVVVTFLTAEIDELNRQEVR